MKPKYALVHQEFLCPVCVEHPQGDWFMNGQLDFGEKVVPVDIHSEGAREGFTEKVFHEFIVPTVQFFEQDVFMNRKVWKCKHLSIGSYDVYGTYKFKKEMLNIMEV